MATWDIDKAVAYLKQNSAGKRSLGKCARYVKAAIKAGGIILGDQFVSAKDYGPSLIGNGFHTQGKLLAGFKKGDVAVIDGFSGVKGTVKDHPHGHMCMFDGEIWISDFTQNDLYPGSDYTKVRPNYIVFRYEQPNAVTTVAP